MNSGGHGGRVKGCLRVCECMDKRVLECASVGKGSECASVGKGASVRV